MYKLTSPDMMKLQNFKSILRTIHYDSGIHRKMIAQKTNLASQTITNLVGELCDAGIIKEYTIATHSKGRNPVSLMIDYDSFYVMTLDITVASIGIYIHSLKGHIIASQEIALTGQYDRLQSMKATIDTLLARIGEKEQSKVFAIVASVEGIVDEEEGIVIKAANVGWHHLNLNEELAYLDLPVFVRNDVNFIGCYEAILREQNKNMMIIKLGSGVGSAIVADKRVLKGTNNVAGELGHFSVSTTEQPIKCSCGKENCLTKFISKTALIEAYGTTYEIFREDVRRGQPEALAQIEKLCALLGPILANITILLDLECIVLTGEIVEDFEQIIYFKLNQIIRANLSYWVDFKDITIHKNVPIIKISSEFILDYYFNHCTDKIFLWDMLVLKKGK